MQKNGFEKSIRKFYKYLINVSGIYYYISLPVLIILIIGIIAGLFYLFITAGRLPIQWMIALVIGGFVSIFKLFQSLFVKVNSEEPGRALTREEAPGLWAITEEVAEIVGTRPIDEIRITPSTDVAVYEEGNWKAKLQDEAKRVLILGTAVLHDFRINEFKAILAHEYGHFSHRDTAGGEIALRVRKDMFNFFIALVNAGQNTRLNVAFHFLRIYDFVFRRISFGCSRLQEVMADNIAATNYGAESFKSGLIHVIKRELEFDSITSLEFELSKKDSRHLNNLYEIQGIFTEEMEEKLQKELNKETTEDDTHPSPNERFRLTEGLGPVFNFNENDNLMVWDLFTSKDSITMEMTSLVDKLVFKSDN